MGVPKCGIVKMCTYASCGNMEVDMRSCGNVEIWKCRNVDVARCGKVEALKCICGYVSMQNIVNVSMPNVESGNGYVKRTEECPEMRRY